jgi:hypothetical protein
VVRNGTDLWTWSSDGRSATHRVLPAVDDEHPRSLAAASPVTPQQAAEAALRAITPTTRVSTDGTAVVAGRSAYELVLQPKDTGSLIGSVRIAIDGKTHIPTRVQVLAKNADAPAFEVGFTSFDPTRPEAAVFRFNPPPGTKVTESDGPTPRDLLGRGPEARVARQAAAASQMRPRVVGTGWTTVLVVPRPPVTGPDASAVTRAMRTLPRVSGSWGSGHLLKGRLFSALVTDDGRVAVGPVAPDRLYAALARR